MTPAQLTGTAIDHIVNMDHPPCALHRDVRMPLQNLHAAARQAGFELAPVSAFRNFERQLQIWNEKYAGERPLFDLSGQLLDALALSPNERIDAIMQWSAVPGASRHHWGTDLDLIDRQAVAAEYRVQLVRAEFEGAGPFARFNAWMEARAAEFGFFRPFRGVLSGVAAEAWHWSYAPLAEPARRQLTPAVLAAVWKAAPVLGREFLLPRLDELHARFVANIDPPAFIHAPDAPSWA